MKRDTASTIFRTVVFAGAMLGTPACGKKAAAPTTPKETATEPAKPAAEAPATGDEAKTPDADGAAPDSDSEDPCAGGQADPCAGVDRPRGTDDDGGGGMGRGFVLS